MNSKKLETLLSSVTEDQKHINFDVDEIAYDLEIYQAIDYHYISERIKCADLITWIDVDEMVGLRAYYYFHNLMCVSDKPAKHCDITFYWNGINEFALTRKLFLEALIFNEDHIHKIDMFRDLDFDDIMENKKYYFGD